MTVAGGISVESTKVMGLDIWIGLKIQCARFPAARQ
jgi:hypothetical protein